MMWVLTLLPSTFFRVFQCTKNLESKVDGVLPSTSDVAQGWDALGTTGLKGSLADLIQSFSQVLPPQRRQRLL